jgi:hypothetical protein
VADDRDSLEVALAPDGFYPQAFRWRGRWVRVLGVEGVRTCRGERVCRVRTARGRFVLAWHARERRWRLQRGPGWFDRLCARWRHAPRYPL